MDQTLETTTNEDNETLINLTLATPSNPNPKLETIYPPYPWATNRRATLRPICDILTLNITTITDIFKCRRCDNVTPVTYNILQKFYELNNYITMNRHAMFNRATREWLAPQIPDCDVCFGPHCMRPVIAVKKRRINWLFLLLGQTLGFCNLDQLKYFCKHNKIHRTGSKSHVLYLTYFGLCEQLEHSFCGP